ncbi:protein FAR1-RELATED SEQUENCE 5-like [Arachis ipaensis]|uniref:protein FAR1-RELATED SEQUENCE 5-like n=1 Tax=Arachis ipaensis TaxID=130454 RepID=UPI0007AF4669|nr:protein FAR1-RELATED SEQUENCE 5-like [Arachis ipaensis]
MHAKCVIENNDEAGIRPNKTFLALVNEAGGPSNLGFSEKDLRNYITARLRTSNVNADVREMMNYFMRMKDITPNFFYAVKLEDECRFRSAVWVDARCRASYEYYEDVVSFDSTYSTNRHELPFVSSVGVNHHGKLTLLGCALLGNEEIPSYEWVFSQWVTCMGAALQSIITDQCRSMFVFHSYKVYKVPTCYVLPRWSKKIKRKHTYIKSSHDISRSDVSHNAFRGLCAHFYNIAQEFVNDDDETALLHAALEETRAKLTEHRAKKRFEGVAETHTSIGSQNSNVVGVVDIQGSSLVTTKGRSKSKRLGAALKKSFKKSGRRKNKNASPVVRSNAYPDTNFGDLVGRNAPEQVGSFMSLLTSFDKS